MCDEAGGGEADGGKRPNLVRALLSANRIKVAERPVLKTCFKKIDEDVSDVVATPLRMHAHVHACVHTHMRMRMHCARKHVCGAHM